MGLGVALQDSPEVPSEVHVAVQAAPVDVPIACMGQKIRGEGCEEGLGAGRCAAADPAGGHPIPTFLHALCFWGGLWPLLALSLTKQT